MIEKLEQLAVLLDLNRSDIQLHLPEKEYYAFKEYVDSHFTGPQWIKSNRNLDENGVERNFFIIQMHGNTFRIFNQDAS